jgi:hypothetical protein
MSFRSDHVVVPFSAFLERRQQLRAIATGSRPRKPDDASSIATARVNLAPTTVSTDVEQASPRACDLRPSLNSKT